MDNKKHLLQLREIIKVNNPQEAPIKTERVPGEFVSALVEVGPDETIEIIASNEAMAILSGLENN